MKIEIEQDDNKARESAIITTGITAGGLHLRQVTASDISIFEMAGISRPIINNGQPLNLGDSYKVHAAAYVLSSDPKRVCREVFDIREFIGIVNDWVGECRFTKDDFVEIANAVLKLNEFWYLSSSESGKKSPGN